MCEQIRRGIKKDLRSIIAKPWMVVTSSIVLSEIMLLVVEVNKVTIGGPVIPMEWGLIKSLIDPLIVAVFPWSGWVILIPLIGISFVKVELEHLTGLLMLSSISTGAISTLTGFDHPNMGLALTGSFTYLIINTYVSLVYFVIGMLVGRVKRCIR